VTAEFNTLATLTVLEPTQHRQFAQFLDCLSLRDAILTEFGQTRLDGAMPDLPFSPSEYSTRLAKTRAAMQAQDLDAIFVEDPSNMAWLTGYDGWSFYVYQGVIVTHDKEPVWWGRAQDRNGALRTAWMGSSDIVSYAEAFIQSTERHPMQDLAEKLCDLGLGGARIGVELENYYYSAKAHLTLVESLPQANLEDATGLVNWVRAVKSDEELAFMRIAARISERLVDLARERIEPGLAKNTLVADILSEAVKGDGEHW